MEKSILLNDLSGNHYHRYNKMSAKCYLFKKDKIKLS